MPDYQTMYVTLFNVLTDAIEHMDHMNYGLARAVLVQAQQDAEELYLLDEED